MSVEAALREAHDALSRARAEILDSAHRQDTRLFAPFRTMGTAAHLLGRIRDIDTQLAECILVCQSDNTDKPEEP